MSSVKFCGGFGVAPKEEKGSCGETVVQKGFLESPVSSLSP